MTKDAPPTTGAGPRVPWGAVAVFVAIAYGLAWVVTIPLWRSGGLANLLITPLGFAMMATPAIGALVVTLGVLKPDHPARYLGLVPLRPWRRVVGHALLGFLGVQVLGVVAVVIGSVLGIAPLVTPAGTASALATVPVLSALVAIPALGEELGWRGFLLPTLRPLGTWPALVVSGVLWGVWHSPLILLGYNYGFTDVRGVALMTVTTVLVGVLFGWLRMRSASVYPLALAHGALNASVGVFVATLIPAADRTVSSSLLGWLLSALGGTSVGAAVRTESFDSFSRPALVGLTVLADVLYLAAAVSFGQVARLSARRLAALEVRTAELAAERERTAATAVALERVRIARDLHDVVAHHVSVMGIHAGAARGC